MNILITGAKGMIGTALTNNLKTIRDKKNTTRPDIVIDNIYEYDIDSEPDELELYCRNADFVFDLAGVNRPKDAAEYMEGNAGFSVRLIELLQKNNNFCPVMLSSSVQASLEGRYSSSEYGRSKLAAENAFFAHSEKTGAKVAVYRFPNVMGHSRPGYNSAISTFCNAIANGEPYTVNDRETQLEVLYIDDLVEGMFDLLEGREKHCDYDGLSIVDNKNGRFCIIPVTHKITLGYIVDLLLDFDQKINSACVPHMADGSFEKKLYSLFLTYLPADRVKQVLKMNCDDRGSFTELVHTTDCGQISVNISRPGITKGQHWHNSKWEIFIVVHGHGLIQERNINTNETIEFEVYGDKPEAIYMIPGWTHNLINLSDTDDLITVIYCNENFDRSHPDTFSEKVI